MPPLPKITAQVVWLYYDDLDKMQAFYEGVMGFEMVEDQGLARIYRVTDNAFIGTVDGTQGIHPVRNESSVAVALAVDDIHAWYEHLVANDITILWEPKHSEKLQINGMLAEDPGGYTIEIQQFLKPHLQAVFHSD